jgi:hypothetical protein
MTMRKPLLWLICTLLAVHAASAQSSGWQVFVERGVEGGDRLIFINLITGEETSTVVNGNQYTVLPTGVLFEDAETHRALVATPDGQVEPHPLIQPGEFARRVDWTVSSDGRALAWTITGGTPTQLTTTTWVWDGENTRQVFVDGPHDGIRAFPIAFNSGRDILYMDYQPDTIADFTPFRQYAALFSLDLETGETRSLPGEAGCFCGGGIAGGKFLRLTLAESGFDLHVVNLENGLQQRIEGIGLSDYTQGGDVLISPDGARAVYALAQVQGFGTSEQALQTVFILVDLATMTQSRWIETGDLFLHPVAWTDDASAILLTSPQQNGTWKANVEQNTLQSIATVTYLGTMLPPKDS